MRHCGNESAGGLGGWTSILNEGRVIDPCLIATRVNTIASSTFSVTMAVVAEHIGARESIDGWEDAEALLQSSRPDFSSRTLPILDSNDPSCPIDERRSVATSGRCSERAMRSLRQRQFQVLTVFDPGTTNTCIASCSIWNYVAQIILSRPAGVLAIRLLNVPLSSYLA